MKFCHITPIDHLDLVKGRNAHLTLAHIVSGMEGTPEQVDAYNSFYQEVNEGPTAVYALSGCARWPGQSKVD